MKHLLDPVPNIRLIKPDLPPDCQLLFDRSMAKAPEDRYSSATDLAADLTSIAQGEQLVDDSIDPAKLRQILNAFFNESELRDLSFDLGVDYEELPGASKADKAREMVAYFKRRELTYELVKRVRSQRPNVKW